MKAVTQTDILLQQKRCPNLHPSNTLNSVYCGRSKKQTPTSQEDDSLKFVVWHT